MAWRALLAAFAITAWTGGLAATGQPPARQESSGRPLTDRTFERTAKRVARGRYLSEGVLQCFVCHSDRDWNAPGAPPRPGAKGTGHVWADTPWLVAPNLTPDRATGIGRWTDDMLARAIREGVSHDGRPLAPQMYSNAFRFLTDEDLASVIVYLRSRPPVRRPLPATVLPAGMAESLQRRVQQLRAAPAAIDTADAVGRGRYLVRIADCQGCHTAWEAPANPGQFGGGNHVARDGRAAFGANLTPAPSGIPYYSDALFIEAMRTGKVRARALDPIMPWTVFGHMSDDDLRAVFGFLRTLRPIDHNVNNTDAPAFCAACRQTHGLGEHNHARRIERIAVDPATYDHLVGEYVFDDNAVHATVRRDGARLVLIRQGREVELVPVAPGEFESEGLPAPLRFARDAAGRVASFTIMVSERGQGAPDRRAARIR